MKLTMGKGERVERVGEAEKDELCFFTDSITTLEKRGRERERERERERARGQM